MMHKEIFETLSSKLATMTAYELVPKGFKGDVASLPYAIVSVVVSTSGNSDHSGSAKYKGIIHFMVFWEKSEGPIKGLEVVDYLEKNLNNQRLNKLQTFVGSSQDLDADLYNNALARREFSLPFIYYG
jgi:hypothetical protein